VIYLASPYTDPVPSTMHTRYLEARAATADLLRHNHHVYSPIVHCHELSLAHNLPTHFRFWCEYNFHMLARADKLVVLQLDNWLHSRGVGAERAFWTTTKRQPVYAATLIECRGGNLDRVLA